RDFHVTGVQTCALPIYDENAAPLYKQAFLALPRLVPASPSTGRMNPQLSPVDERLLRRLLSDPNERPGNVSMQQVREVLSGTDEIGRASCRERVWSSGV